MCIDSILVDSVPCDVSSSCQGYFKDLSKGNVERRDEENTLSIECKINEIEVHRRSTIVMKTFYFPRVLLKLHDRKSFSARGIWISNFTSSINIHHNDDVKTLYYQRPTCSSQGKAIVTFIDGGGDEPSSIGKVPLWIYAASVAGALLLLLGLVLILIRLGFFESKDIGDIYVMSLTDDDNEEEWGEIEL